MTIIVIKLITYTILHYNKKLIFFASIKILQAQTLSGYKKKVKVNKYNAVLYRKTTM